MLIALVLVNTLADMQPFIRAAATYSTQLPYSTVIRGENPLFFSPHTTRTRAGTMWSVVRPSCPYDAPYQGRCGWVRSKPPAAGADGRHT